MPRRGVEHLQQSPGKGGFPEVGGAECGAQRAPEGQFEPDLQRLIDAWPTLPDPRRAGIVAMVDAATKSDGQA